jgi:hypothetical protein
MSSPVPNGGGSAAAQGRFVFTSLDGNRVYVLAQADAAAGLAVDWGLITFETRRCREQLLSQNPRGHLTSLRHRQF